MNITRIYEIAKHVLVHPKIIWNASVVLYKEGFDGVSIRLQALYYTHRYRYDTPCLTHEIISEIEAFEIKPLISILTPSYNVDQKWLSKAIQSVRHQWYPHWELCIVDDASTNASTINCLKNIDDPKIKICFSTRNENISVASNLASAMAQGEYFALLDHDDEISVDALYEMVRAINREQADFLYSDEDFLTINGWHVSPHFKPDFSPDLLLSHNYITHFALFGRRLFEEVGGFRSRCDGAQDYDLFLRISEKAENIVHIPKVLYHWRMLPSSTSADSGVKPKALESGKAALQDALKRRGIDGSVEEGNLMHYFRVRRNLSDKPLVSIIIPFKDRADLLTMCLDSIVQRSTYKNFEVIGVSNNSVEPQTFELMRQYVLQDQRIKFYEFNQPFNYAQINNDAVFHHARGAHILLLNNDIEIISPEWIESLLEHSQRSEVGCVGAKLYYPDGKIQHAGVILGLGGYAAHSHRLSNGTDHGYFNRLNVIQDYSAVTGACLMVKKSIYEAVGGLDAAHFKIAYNDVDFCLRVREAGFLNIFTPYCEAYHHESQTRGEDDKDMEKTERFDREKANLKARHAAILEQGDPYYNPNFSTDSENFALRFVPFAPCK